MKLNFDMPESSDDNIENTTLTNSINNNDNNNSCKKKERGFSYSPNISNSKDDIEWVPLQEHPVFSPTAANESSEDEDSDTQRLGRNLMVWDGVSRIYFWDSRIDSVCRISVRLGDPEPTSVLAATPSKVLEADIDIDYAINKISINRNGSALALSSSDGIYIMYLYGRSSARDDPIVCRTVPVGNGVYQKSDSAIRILQVAWHPYSDTHFAVLSSDSVFRIFDLSSGLDLPEQEYYLQPVEPGRSGNASSFCPVDFSFGSDHLWDKFSVFILFSDGSVYTLCPVAPFGSVYLWKSILEIYSDAQTFGQKSSDSIAFSNSSMAISWLEATFPELNQHEGEPSHISTVKAHPFVLIDSSLSLQGPLCKLYRGEEDHPGFRGTECRGRAVSFLYNSVGKDSILVTAWSDGQLHFDALADEIQPLWNTGNSPRLSFDSRDRILGFAMICESVGCQLSVVRVDRPLDYCDPPPLLRLASVDLALPNNKLGDSTISMYIDPLIPERIYCLHDGGVDSIVLRFLPFTHQSRKICETTEISSVHPVISTCSGSTASSTSLFGFVVLSDSFGYCWIAGVTSTQECIVLEMKTWNVLLPKVMDMDKPNESEGDRVTPDSISRELLVGPKVVMVPQGSNLRSIAADSIEGRTALHQYFNLFHENYVEYAHKVHFELKQHGPLQKKMIDNLHTRLSEAHQKLLNAEKKQPQLDDRMKHAIQRHESLEERLHNLRRLPGIHKKPLTKAEREFKADLGSEDSTISMPAPNLPPPHPLPAKPTAMAAPGSHVIHVVNDDSKGEKTPSPDRAEAKMEPELDHALTFVNDAVKNLDKEPSMSLMPSPATSPSFRQTMDDAITDFDNHMGMVVPPVKTTLASTGGSFQVETSPNSNQRSGNAASNQGGTPVDSQAAASSARMLGTLALEIAPHNASLEVSTPINTSYTCTLHELTPLSIKCQALAAPTATRSKFFPLLKCLEAVQQAPMNSDAIVGMQEICDKLKPLFTPELEVKIKDFLSQRCQAIGEWHEAHTKYLHLETKRAFLAHESFELCDSIQRSEGAYAEQQQTLLSLQQRLTDAEALVLSLKNEIKNFQARSPEEFVGHPLYVVKEKLEEATTELPAMDEEIARMTTTISVLMNEHAIATQQFMDFVSKL